MQETWAQSLGWEDPLEKETATHSSILAWKIPWTEEPSRLSPQRRKESDMTERLSLSLSELSEWTDSFGPELAWSANITSSKDTLNHVYYLFAPVFSSGNSFSFTLVGY